MELHVKELYEVAQEYVTESFLNPQDYSQKVIDDALTVIELVEDGKHEEALNVGLIY